MFAKEAFIVGISSKTPHYVLREGNHPTALIAVNSASLTTVNVIFGFSDKPQYDAFLSLSSVPLTPYPLVKRFLVDQLAIDGEALRLVALDAPTPTQELISAATFQSVLSSLQCNADFVPVTHQLCRDNATSGYTLKTLDDES
jgi:hypothetical protein